MPNNGLNCKNRDALLFAILVATLILLVLAYRLGSAAGMKQVQCPQPKPADPIPPPKTAR